MTLPTIKIVNVETGEEIEREMTNEEYAQLQMDQAEAEANLVKKAAKAQARQALLDRLGITEDEAKLLLGGN